MLAAQEGWRVHHMDVKSSFLNHDLKEDVYVRQPSGFTSPGKEDKVFRLRKAPPVQGPLRLAAGTAGLEREAGRDSQVAGVPVERS